MNSVLTALREAEQQIVTYDQPAPVPESGVAVLHGTVPILISAPHSARHWRENNWKQEEEYTAALGFLLHQETGATFVYGQYSLNPDPHADNDSSPYKQTLSEVIQAEPFRLLIDLHGARGDRDFAVALGTMRGETFDPYEAALVTCLEAHGFTDDPESSLDRLALNPGHYTGGLRQPTITRYVWQQHHLPSVQVELISWVRIVERLPSASNAKNGTAPRFRGDSERIRRVYLALRSFIEQTLNA